MPSTRPLPTVIGPAENALRALLIRTLSSTLIPSYPAWVILNAASTADSSNDWRHRAADGMKVDADEIDGALTELRTAGLVDGEGGLTAVGTAELTTARAAITGTTLRLIEGIDETEQETTRRVLDAIRRKAEGLLGA